mmetsp:Transcript_4967/g.31785  ORF Transcript_4967/g.31785 Transcript_4967/m.31785 type:complete len:94 (+) Transcript_4967:1011-1292(+)
MFMHVKRRAGSAPAWKRHLRRIRLLQATWSLSGSYLERRRRISHPTHEKEASFQFRTYWLGFVFDRRPALEASLYTCFKKLCNYPSLPFSEAD